MRYALMLMILAIVAAVVGFGRPGEGVLGTAHLLAICFGLLAAVSLAVGLLRNR